MGYWPEKVDVLPRRYDDWPWRVQNFWWSYRTHMERTETGVFVRQDHYVPHWMGLGWTGWTGGGRLCASLIADWVEKHPIPTTRWGIKQGADWIPSPPSGPWKSKGDRVEALLEFFLRFNQALDLKKSLGEARPHFYSDDAAREFLAGLIANGTTRAATLTNELAVRFGLSVTAADTNRRRLGFKPAYRSGPVQAPEYITSAKEA